MIMTALETINLSTYWLYGYNIFVLYYFNRYETENGISYAEEGKLKHIGNENEAIVKTGSYKYTGLNSETINIAYTADENGYKAKVNIRLLPPSPPIVIQASPALLASLVGR